jgi:hypothetical protein
LAAERSGVVGGLVTRVVWRRFVALDETARRSLGD